MSNSAAPAQIDITVNGERRSVAAGLTVQSLLSALGVEASRVAVEFNREILRRDRWGSTSVAEGAEIEIVQFVGGG
jgi:sulfur carrier protein